MPFVSESIAALLLQHEGFDAVIASDGRFDNPLVGIYSCGKAAVLYELIKSGDYKPFHFLHSINSKTVVIPPEFADELKGHNTLKEIYASGGRL